MQKTKLALSIVSAAALLTLAACGGGGGDSAPPAQQPATPTPPATPAITVQGSATAVQADPLAVIFVPHTEKSTQPVLQSIASAVFPAQFQKSSAEGAYTQLGIDANSVISLTTGKVIEVAGNGDFAIGRWTDGSSTLGTVSVNQADHYAVGKPLTLQRVLGPTAKLNCTLAGATSPTAVSGNFPAGKVNSASAVIDLNGPLLESASLDVSIGSDAHAAVTTVGAGITGINFASGVLLHLQTLGTDQTRPYLAVGYAMPTPTSGDVTGVVVLKCQ